MVNSNPSGQDEAIYDTLRPATKYCPLCQMINTVFIKVFEQNQVLDFFVCVFADCTILYRDYVSLRQNTKELG